MKMRDRIQKLRKRTQNKINKALDKVRGHDRCPDRASELIRWLQIQFLGYRLLEFPDIHRIWPNLVAKDIVSVQPMSSPVSEGLFKFERIKDSVKFKSGQAFIMVHVNVNSKEGLVDTIEIWSKRDNEEKGKDRVYLTVKHGTGELVGRMLCYALDIEGNAWNAQDPPLCGCTGYTLQPLNPKMVA